jgi:hypothetical protein
MVVCIGALLLVRADGQRKLDEQLSNLRAAGVPLTPQERDAVYQLPPGADDCTPQWRRAFALVDAAKNDMSASGLPYVSLSIDAPEAPLPGEDWPERAEAEALLAQLQPALDLMHDAARRGGAARYPTDIEPLFSDVFKAREAFGLLQLEASVRAHRGDVPGTMESMKTLRALGHSWNNVPDKFAWLSGCAIDFRATDTLERLLPYLNADDTQLADLQDRWSRLDPTRQLVAMLRGERVRALEVFGDPGSIDDSGVMRLLHPITDAQEQAHCLTYFDRMEAAASGPLPAAPGLGEQIDNDFQAHCKAKSDLVRSWIMVVPGQFENSCRTACHAAALRDMAIYALAAERYRLRHGQWPEALSDITPDLLPAAWANSLPVDPFDGQPLRYVVDDDGLRVYSVGRNGRDDGGLDDYYKGDIVFHIAR